MGRKGGCQWGWYECSGKKMAPLWVVVVCDERRAPVSMMLPRNGNYLQSGDSLQAPPHKRPLQIAFPAVICAYLGSSVLD